MCKRKSLAILALGFCTQHVLAQMPRMPSHAAEADLLRIEARVLEALTADQLEAYAAGQDPDAIVLHSGDTLDTLLQQELQGTGFKIPWFSADAGSSPVSTGESFSLRASIGQPDASRLQGGRFQLMGGFLGIRTQDQLPIFHDGFELDNCSAWSSINSDTSC